MTHAHLFLGFRTGLDWVHGQANTDKMPKTKWQKKRGASTSKETPQRPVSKLGEVEFRRSNIKTDKLESSQLYQGVQRMLTKSIKLTLPAAALMIAFAGLSTTATAASGGVYKLCELHNAPPHVLKQIADRDDFGDILAMMQSTCAGGAAIFTEAPTASVNFSPRITDEEIQDRQDRRERRKLRESLRMSNN